MLLLLRANEAVSRDRLIDDLGLRAACHFCNALAAIVARLRRVLPGEVLLTTQGGYELSIDPRRSTSTASSLVEEGRSARQTPAERRVRAPAISAGALARPGARRLHV